MVEHTQKATSMSLSKQENSSFECYLFPSTILKIKPEVCGGSRAEERHFEHFKIRY